MLTVKTNHAEVLLDLVQGSPLRSAAMAAAQLVSGACAQTHAQGAAGQHSPSTPAHAKHTTLVKVPYYFQASNAQQRRGALPFGAQSNHLERAGGDQHLKPQLQNQQRPSKLTPLQGLSAGLLQAFSRQLSVLRAFRITESFPRAFGGCLVARARKTREQESPALQLPWKKVHAIMVVVISLQNSDFNYDKHTN